MRESPSQTFFQVIRPGSERGDEVIDGTAIETIKFALSETIKPLDFELVSHSKKQEIDGL